ncbi:MAG TPA: hypothetical protein VF533_11085, partial [Solirubrobacteraceae bacterium]
DLLHKARFIPFSDQVRVGAGKLAAAVTRVRAAVPADRAQTMPLVEQLEAHTLQAPRIPFTSEVRVDREAVYDVLDRLRAA